MNSKKKYPWLDETTKEYDAITEVFLFSVFGSIILRLIGKRAFKISPLYLTLATFVFGIATLFLLFFGFSLFAFIVYFVSLVLDNIDGRVARLQGSEGMWRATMDQLFDQIILCSLIFMYILIIDDSWVIWIMLLILMYLSEVLFILNVNLNATLKTRKQETNGENLASTDDNVNNAVGSVNAFIKKYGVLPYPTLSDLRLLVGLYLIFSVFIVSFLSLLIVIFNVSVLLLMVGTKTVWLRKRTID